MYNGIGLSTVRGSSTSGHVQKNHSYVRPEFFRNKLDKNTGRQQNQSYSNDGVYKVNKEVIDHNRKFALEVEVFELQENLADAGESQENIDKQVAALRAKQQQSMVTVSDTPANSNSRKLSTTDTHAASAAKERENSRVRGAFGLGEDFAPGAAFDKDAQEQRRHQREEDRVRDRKQREIDYQKRVQARAERAEKDRQREEEYRKGREARADAAHVGKEEGTERRRDSRDRDTRRQGRRDGGSGNSRRPRYVPVDRERQEQGRSRDNSRSRSRDRAQHRRRRHSSSGSSDNDEDREARHQRADNLVSAEQQIVVGERVGSVEGLEVDRSKRRSRFSAGVVAPEEMADGILAAVVVVDDKAQEGQEEFQRLDSISENRNRAEESPSPPRGRKKVRRIRSRSPSSSSSSESSRSSRSSSSASRSRSSRSSRSRSRSSSERSLSTSDSDSGLSSTSSAVSSSPRKTKKEKS